MSSKTGYPQHSLSHVRVPQCGRTPRSWVLTGRRLDAEHSFLRADSHGHSVALTILPSDHVRSIRKQWESSCYSFTFCTVISFPGKVIGGWRWEGDKESQKMHYLLRIIRLDVVLFGNLSLKIFFYQFLVIKTIAASIYIFFRSVIKYKIAVCLPLLVRVCGSLKALKISQGCLLIRSILTECSPFCQV